jgi:tetratricopeptide (TPR) repeat protein
MDMTSGPGVQAIQRPGMDTLQAVIPWLRSAAPGPFFLLLHIFEPHSPYEPPEPFASRFATAYDGEVAAADAVVGRLLEELDALGVYDRALVVFLSDHGEGLGEHGEDEHGLLLYRSTLQVPLILKLPHSARAGESVADPVQLIDVVPTVAEALDLAGFSDLRGSTLLGAQRPAADEREIYAETFFPRLHFGWSELTALVKGRYQYIDAPEPELYDLVEDPDQTTSLVESDPAVAVELRGALTGYERPFNPPQAVDDDTRRRLEALGYVGTASPQDPGELADPKTKVGTLVDIREAYRLYAAGDYQAAAASFAAIVADNPAIEDAWEYLALSQIGLGEMEDAVATYRAAVERLPDSGRISLRLAMLLYRLGRLDEAFVQANLASTYDAAAAHVLLGQIAFHRGDLEAAEAEARQAMAVDARQPGPYLVLADVAVARGEPAMAAEVLTGALNGGVTHESVRAKLAMTYLWMGDLLQAQETLEGYEDTGDLGLLMAFGRVANARQRWPEARAWFEKALQVDPGNPEAALNLGIVLVAEGSVEQARANLEYALSRIPGSYEGWNALGVTCARQGDLEAATSAWERARQVNPEAVDVLFNLGLVNAQAGNLVKAIEYLEDYASRAGAGPQRERALAMAQRLRARASQSP